jgi:hypothetical protein
MLHNHVVQFTCAVPVYLVYLVAGVLTIEYYGNTIPQPGPWGSCRHQYAQILEITVNYCTSSVTLVNIGTWGTLHYSDCQKKPLVLKRLPGLITYHFMEILGKQDLCYRTYSI